MHVSQGTQTANPHSYPKSALKDKATMQLHRQGLRRFQFRDWSMQSFSIGVFSLKFVEGGKYTGFQRNISMKWLYTNIWRMPDIAKLVRTPTSGKFHPAEQTSAICFRSEKEKRVKSSSVLDCKLENQGASPAYATLETWLAFITVPWLSLGSPSSQSVSTELVGISPHSNTALLTQLKYPAGPTPWGRRFTYPQKSPTGEGERDTSKWKKRGSRWAGFVWFSKIPSLHGDVQITFKFP